MSLKKLQHQPITFTQIYELEKITTTTATTTTNNFHVILVLAPKPFFELSLTTRIGDKNVVNEVRYVLRLRTTIKILRKCFLKYFV